MRNRIRRNATTNNHAYPMRYDWDVLNRASTIAKPSGGASYSYRADGQRIEKVEGVTFAWVGSKTSGQYDTNYAQNRPSSRYYYDGQMGFEDDYNPSGTVTKVTRNLLGARGIDRISTTTHGYPLYDGHGNCRAILTKNGTSYGTGNWRTYDVWGSVRSGTATGDPKSRYVASIGHVADDESSLTYMRARYYEPATGRFLSEYPARDGKNWYVYCWNNPTNLADATGTVAGPLGILEIIIGMLSSLDGGYQTGLGTRAMLVFLSAAGRITSAVKLEESWREFMKDWSGSLSGAFDVSGVLGFAIAALSVAFGYVSGGISNLFTGACVAMQMFTLTVAYTARLMWYVKDIDLDGRVVSSSW